MKHSADFQPISNPASLNEVNYILNNFALPSLNAKTFDALKKIQPRETLVAALRSLQFKGDRGAYVFLQKQIEMAMSQAGTQAGEKKQDMDKAIQQETPKATSPKPIPHQPKKGSAQPMDQDDNDVSAEEREKPKSVHVYGGKGALCFEEDTTKNGFHTVAIDAAQATGPKQYEWSNKIRIQLTREELPVFLGVMLGVLPQCEYKNHGPQNNKGFSIQDQGNQFFVRVFGPEGVRAVPMTPEDAFRVSALLLKQMRKNHPALEGNDIVTLVRLVIGKKTQAPKQRQMHCANPVLDGARGATAQEACCPAHSPTPHPAMTSP